MALRRFSTSNISGTKSSKVWDGETFPGYFESIATIIVGSTAVSNVEFTNIPNTYTHLQIRAIARSDNSNSDMNVTFNTDSGTNYSYHQLHGTGASVTTYSGASVTAMTTANATPNNTSTFSGTVIDILDYANTNKYKTIRTLTGYDANGSGRISLSSGLWMSTSSVTSIKITDQSSYKYQQYSHFSLYGIRS